MIVADEEMDMGPIDISLISDFEKKKGISFSIKYKELVTKHNPFWPKDRKFDFWFSGKKGQRDVTFFGYGEHLKNYERIEFAQPDEYSNEKIVVIGESSNGDYVCFDYRENPETDNPPIVLMLHDYFTDDGEMSVCPVAEDFEQFIDSLY